MRRGKNSLQMRIKMSSSKKHIFKAKYRLQYQVELSDEGRQKYEVYLKRY